MNATIALEEDMADLKRIAKSEPAIWSWTKSDDVTEPSHVPASTASPVPVPAPAAAAVVIDESTTTNNNTNNTNNNTNNTSNNTNNNTDNSITDNSVTNNNNFNLHFYLNETCKDAMDIVDFSERLQAKYRNVDYVNDRVTWNYMHGLAHMSYVDGVIQMITDELRDIPQHQRPIQCTDLKRGTMQVRHRGEWKTDTALIATFIYEMGRTRAGYAFDWKKVNNQLYDDRRDLEQTAILSNVSPNVTAGEKRTNTPGAKDSSKVLSAIAELTLVHK